jgi:hypothetical protein
VVARGTCAHRVCLMGISTIPRIGFSTVRFSVSRLDWRNGARSRRLPPSGDWR